MRELAVRIPTMPNTEKARNRGRSGAGQQQAVAVTPTKHDHTPANTPTSKLTAALTTDTLGTLIERLDQLEATINLNKLSSDELTAQTHKDLTDIKSILESNHEERLHDRRRLMIAELNLRTVTALNAKLTEKVNEFENHSKICNIRIDGKSESEGEDLNKFVNDLAMFLNPNSQRGPIMTAIYRIGKLTQNNNNNHGGRRPYRPRTIMATFTTATDRNAFYFARMKLKGSPMYKGIYLNDDVSVETRKAREDFRSVAALARSEGANVRVHSDGILIDGVKYKTSEPQSLPARFALSRAKTIKSGDEIYFHSEHSFLSNFYKVPIVVNNEIYQTAEHKYQADKCEAAGDNDNRDRVLMALTPLDAKRIGDTITESTEWKRDKEAVMTGIINLKFDQNPDIAKLLIETGDLQLNEATSNTFFGIGAMLHSREIPDKSYRGQNKLGMILMAKRRLINQN